MDHQLREILSRCGPNFSQHRNLDYFTYLNLALMVESRLVNMSQVGNLFRALRLSQYAIAYRSILQIRENGIGYRGFSIPPAGYGVSQAAGNYLLYAINPGLTNFIKFSLVEAVYNQSLVAAESQLTAVLEANNLTVVELYHRLAIPYVLLVYIFSFFSSLEITALM